MTFLLDTNTISELIKPIGNPRVIDWLDDHEPQSFLCVATFAEIQRGIDLLADGRRRTLLTQWIDEMIPYRFAGRIIDIDRRVARVWSRLMVRSQRKGAPLAVMDGFIAAAASEHGLILVTRNVRHFSSLDIPLINPWDDASQTSASR